MEPKADCLVVISNLLPNMLESEKKIAQLILSSPEDVVRMPIKVIAQHAQVAEASIIRFCKKLGYKGISDLKLHLAQSLVPGSAITISEVSPYDSGDEVVKKVFATSKKALDDTVSMLDYKAFEQTVRLILSAKKIEFYGVGTSSQIAADAYYRLMRVGFPVYVATDPHIMRISASLLGKGNLAIAISHTGRTIDTIQALGAANKSGADTVCITSYLKSPITQIADISLVTTTAETQYMREAVSSRIAQIALLDALYTAVCMQRNSRVAKNIALMNDILEEVRM